MTRGPLVLRGSGEFTRAMVRSLDDHDIHPSGAHFDGIRVVDHAP